MDTPTDGEDGSTVNTIQIKGKIDVLTPALQIYFKGAVNYIPSTYVVTPAYIKLKSLQFDESKKPRIAVCGPKGVGKSLSLLTLAVEMTDNKERVLYFSSFTLDFSYKIKKDYLMACGFSCEYDDLCTEIMNEEVNGQEKKLTLFLDLGKGDYPGDSLPLINQFRPIIHGNYGVQVIVALSSGEGGLFKEDQLLQNFMSCATKIRFKNFSHNEALTFCRSFPGMEAKYSDLSELSNNNPGLLYRLEEFCSEEKDWKQHMKASADVHIHTFISETFKNLVEMEKRNFMHQGCKLTPYFLKCAANGDDVPLTYKSDFLVSFVFSEGICYTVKERCFNISLTFPGSEFQILQEVKQSMGNNSSAEEQKISQILGYKFQLEFFRVCSSQQTFVIHYKKPGCSGDTLRGLQLVCLDTLQSVVGNCLMPLRPAHPVIDYVGVIDEYIIFFQISLSLYIHHESKFKDINRKYSKSPEFVEKTVLEYYRDYFNKSKVIFIYVSPKEKNEIPNSLNTHAINLKLAEVYLGCIVLETNSPLATFMLNYN